MASVSPFIAALPSQHMLFQYDADGDAIMIDAETGSPIRYHVPSEAPLAPIRAPRAALQDDEGDDSAFSVIRNLGDALAEIDLPYNDHAAMGYFWPISDSSDADPSVRRVALIPDSPTIDFRCLDTPTRHLEMSRYSQERSVLIASSPVAPSPIPPPGGEAAEANSYGDSEDEEDEWIIQAKVPDLALRLDMRHPRVLLSFLRFVETYNELAPEGEEIHIPRFSAQNIEYVRSHEGVRNVPPEFESEVAELNALLERYRKDEA